MPAQLTSYGAILFPAQVGSSFLNVSFRQYAVYTLLVMTPFINKVRPGLLCLIQPLRRATVAIIAAAVAVLSSYARLASY